MEVLYFKRLSNKFQINSEGVSNKYYNGLKESIREFQNKFIIIYVDKVNANYAIICKLFLKRLIIMI